MTQPITKEGKIIQAAKEGDLIVIKKLLQERSDQDISDVYSKTIGEALNKVTEKLLQAEVNIPKKDDYLKMFEMLLLRPRIIVDAKIVGGMLKVAVKNKLKFATIEKILTYHPSPDSVKAALSLAIENKMDSKVIKAILAHYPQNLPLENEALSLALEKDYGSEVIVLLIREPISILYMLKLAIDKIAEKNPDVFVTLLQSISEKINAVTDTDNKSYLRDVFNESIKQVILAAAKMGDLKFFQKILDPNFSLHKEMIDTINQEKETILKYAQDSGNQKLVGFLSSINEKKPAVTKSP